MIVQVLWVCVILLLVVAALEVFSPHVLNEGFATLMAVGESPFWSLNMPKRGDIGLDPRQEEGGYIRDPRYFADYVDIQGLSVKHDFCRMVQPSGSGDDQKFFACALGGTAGLSSVTFKTQAVKQGFRISRDDYMNTTEANTLAYCRIVKFKEFAETPFQAICTKATPSGFKSSVMDANDAKPPPKIQKLLQFYQGIVIWLRFIDDMNDYAQNLIINKAGAIGIQEKPPKPKIARTLEFDGLSQYLKIGDSTELNFGTHINLRYLRSVSFWIYFEEFTNNAHIYDFGNGAGKDNVFMGIVGRGNQNAIMDPFVLGCKLENESTVPPKPSGAQTVDETTPQHLMETTSANVNEFVSVEPEVYGRTLPCVQPFAMPQFTGTTADLLYEVWDSQQRKLHLQIPGAFRLKEWTHVVLTTTSRDATRPGLRFYINGGIALEDPNGWLPQDGATTSNYIGKSNWSSSTSNAANADELFKGKLFDFRGYYSSMTPSRVADTYKWGQVYLGLKPPPEEPTTP